MMKLTNDALAQMIVVVEKPEHQSIDINKSFNIENEINNYRNQLKNQNILDVKTKNKIIRWEFTTWILSPSARNLATT